MGVEIRPSGFSIVAAGVPAGQIGFMKAESYETLSDEMSLHGEDLNHAREQTQSPGSIIGDSRLPGQARKEGSK